MLLSYYVALLCPNKEGGDDVPREETWETRKPSFIRDATLDTIIKQAYDKAVGHIETVAIVANTVVFDYDADDEDVLMLMMD